MGFRRYCLQFPSSIQAELRMKYDQWYKESLFLDQLDSTILPVTLILPAEELLNMKNPPGCPAIIAFGSQDKLEPSFLAGASDYLKDPWDCRELIIRCSSGERSVSLSIDGHCFQCSQDILTMDGTAIKLNGFQTSMIHILMKRTNRIVTYEEIRELMGMSSADYVKSIHVHVNRIRKAMNSQLPGIYGKCFSIENMRSRGYCFKIPCE